MTMRSRYYPDPYAVAAPTKGLLDLPGSAR
jgi:hypothetical protein